MSFLAPLFLLGLLAVGLPILYHLVRRRTKDRIPFSSLMFLQPTPPRLNKRSRLENIGLLLLRCLVLILLAFAFARPFLESDASTTEASPLQTQWVVLVDRSASMKRPGLWDQAVDRAEEIIARIPSTDPLAVFAYDQGLQPVLSFEQALGLSAQERKQNAAEHLAVMKPGWKATFLDLALAESAELFNEFESSTEAEGFHAIRQIVVITDFQQGSRLSGLQGAEWERNLAVQMETVVPEKTSNAGLHPLPQIPSPNQKPTLRLRLTNSEDSQQEVFKVGIASQNQRLDPAKSVEVYLPPGQNRIVEFESETPANPSTPVTAILEGDDGEFDNRAFLIPFQSKSFQLPYFGPTDADRNSPWFYLERAFQSTSKETVQLVPNPADTTNMPSTAPLSILITAPPPDHLAELKRRMVQGHNALVLLTPQTAANVLPALLEKESLSVTSTDPTRPLIIGWIDFHHPLFTPFADPRYSDFTRIHFWQYRSWSLEENENLRVLARFDNDQPWLVEAAVGEGRAWILTSGWTADESQLALSTKFVPLLYSLLDLARGTGDAPTQLWVGQPLPNLPPSAGTARLTLPNGNEQVFSADDSGFIPEEPGVYQLKNGDAETFSFAVNLNPAESQTATRSIEDLDALKVPMQSGVHVAETGERTHKRNTRLSSLQQEKQQNLWRWLIAGACLFLLAETFWSTRLSRRRID